MAAAVDGTAGEQTEADPDSTGVEATERLQREFPAEDFASPEDLAEVQRVTADVAPEQMGIALEGVLGALRGDGVLDCETLAAEMMVSPEKALEIAQAVVGAHTRMITKNLFGGDQELHGDFVQWAIKNHREAYAKASEACARTQSSKPMQPLVKQRMAALQAEAKKAEAKRPKQQQQQAPKPTDASSEPWWEREEREWHERRGLKY